jgi:hypothetical protein
MSGHTDVAVMLPPPKIKFHIGGNSILIVIPLTVA